MALVAGSLEFVAVTVRAHGTLKPKVITPQAPQPKKITPLQ